jgi:hypothetical protein
VEEKKRAASSERPTSVEIAGIALSAFKRSIERRTGFEPTTSGL